jgi:Transglutaminase-like superfamily
VWVLFDYKKGFCNYYASAEVLMLRSIGIPARMAVGFAQGESPSDLSDSRSISYTVLNRDAHAWPEVYFSGIGWIEFEPTVNQNPIVRPQTKSQIAAQQNNSANTDSNQPAENPSSTSTHPIIFNTILGDILLIGFSLLFIGLIIFAFRRYHLLNQVPVYLSNSLERIGVPTPSWVNAWMNWNQMTSVEHSFASINLGLRWLGNPQPVSTTAAERAAELTKLLPSAAAYIEAVSSEHQAALFTQHPADLSRARRAAFMVMFHTLRITVLKIWNAISGGDVYSR